jgi:hypothetical protein
MDDLEIESNNATRLRVPSALPEHQPQALTLTPEQAYKTKISELVVGEPTQGFQGNIPLVITMSCPFTIEFKKIFGMIQCIYLVGFLLAGQMIL